jgi:hypothetical protein
MPILRRNPNNAQQFGSIYSPGWTMHTTEPCNLLYIDSYRMLGLLHGMRELVGLLISAGIDSAAYSRMLDN